MRLRYRSVAKALAAAQRMANRTGRPIKVLVQNPRQKYPKKLAAKYIRQEFRAGRKGKQAVAIGIARARRAVKKNPPRGLTPAQQRRATALYAARLRAEKVFLRKGSKTARGQEAFTRSQAIDRALRRMGRARGPFPAPLGITWLPPRHNPEWLTGAVSRKIESGQHMTRFYDSGRKLRAEMFESGGAPRLLVYNPAWKPRRKSLVRKKFQTRRTRRTRRAGVAGLRKRR